MALFLPVELCVCVFARVPRQPSRRTRSGESSVSLLFAATGFSRQRGRPDEDYRGGSILGPFALIFLLLFEGTGRGGKSGGHPRFSGATFFPGGHPELFSWDFPFVSIAGNFPRGFAGKKGKAFSVSGLINMRQQQRFFPSSSFASLRYFIPIK